MFLVAVSHTFSVSRLTYGRIQEQGLNPTGGIEALGSISLSGYL